MHARAMVSNDSSAPDSEVWEEVEVTFTGEDGKKEALPDIRKREATIGGVVDANTAVWKSLFDRPTFRITTVRDAAGEWCSGGDVAASRHQCPPLRQPWNCAVR